MKNKFSTVDHLSAKDFFDAILSEKHSPENRRVVPIFRGMSSDEYPLVPSSERKDAARLYGFSRDVSRQRAIWVRLREFYTLGLKQGLPLPSLPPELHKQMVRGFYPYGPHITESMISDFLERDLLELLALAQHYGLKTPLLDWSSSPLIAANFAIDGALESMIDFMGSLDLSWQGDRKNSLKRLQEFGRKKIVVCVLDRALCGLISDYWSHRVKTNTNVEALPYKLSIIDPPTQSNRNIVAQMGCFTWHKENSAAESTHDSRATAVSDSVCLSVALGEICEHLLSEDAGGFAGLRSGEEFKILKFHTLPYYECFRLHDLLCGSDRHPSTMYPGLEGCAKHIIRQSDIGYIRQFVWGPDETLR